jgi:membrane associated rhomboid family serine protease
VFPLKDNIPTRRFPLLTVAIILANVAMFLVFQGATVGFGGARLNEARVIEYGAIPYEVTHPGEQCIPRGRTLACGPEREVERIAGEDLAPTWLTVLTAMFMHGGLLHIFGNMLFLWIFGNNIEDSMGRIRFLLFYILGGVAALAAQVAIQPDAQIPTIGASGAVAAVLGGYALLYPRARVITVIFIIFFFQFVELPAMVVLGLWFLLQLLYGTAELAQPVAGGGGVAYWAHIGGFLFGMVFIRLFANRVKEDYLGRSRIPVY